MPWYDCCSAHVTVVEIKNDRWKTTESLCEELNGSLRRFQKFWAVCIAKLEFHHVRVLLSPPVPDLLFVDGDLHVSLSRTVPNTPLLLVLLPHPPPLRESGATYRSSARGFVELSSQ